VLLIMGLQSGVEGDYYGYENAFKEAQTWGSLNYHDTEVGWYFLIKIFSFSSFPVFIFAISFLQYIILSKFVKRYISGSYQYIAAILFFFTFSFMLLQMKAIRQGLAVELCVAAFMYMDKKKFWASLLLVLAAYSIHNSSLIIAPFIILYYCSKKFHWFEKKISKKDFLYPIMWTAIFLVVYSLKTTILQKYLMSLSNSTELLRFSGYFKDVEYQFDISWLIVFYNALMVFTVTWFYKYASPTMRFFSILSVIAAFCDMLFFGLGSLPRVFLFFSIFNIVVYPNVAESIKRKFGSVVSLAYIVICVAYAFKTSLPWMLTTAEARFGTFKFIFQ
jgi:hypothetical protein